MNQANKLRYKEAIAKVFPSKKAPTTLGYSGWALGKRTFPEYMEMTNDSSLNNEEEEEGEGEMTDIVYSADLDERW